MMHAFETQKKITDVEISWLPTHVDFGAKKTERKNQSMKYKEGGACTMRENVMCWQSPVD